MLGDLRWFVHRELGNLRSIRRGTDARDDDEVIASISRCDVGNSQDAISRTCNGCVVVIPLVGKSIASGSDGKADSITDASSKIVGMCSNLRRFVDNELGVSRNRRRANPRHNDGIQCFIGSRDSRQDQNTVSSPIDRRTVFVPLVGEAIASSSDREDCLFTQTDCETIRLSGNQRWFIHRKLGNLRSIRRGTDARDDDEVIASIGSCDVGNSQDAISRTCNGCVVVIPLVGKSIASGSDGKADSITDASSKIVGMCSNLRRFVDNELGVSRNRRRANPRHNDGIQCFIGSRDSRQDQNTVSSPIDRRTVFVPLVGEAIASSSDREDCLFTQTDCETIRLSGNQRWFIHRKLGNLRSIRRGTDARDDDEVIASIGSCDVGNSQDAISRTCNGCVVVIPLVGKGVANGSDGKADSITDAGSKTGGMVQNFGDLENGYFNCIRGVASTRV